MIVWPVHAAPTAVSAGTFVRQGNASPNQRGINSDGLVTMTWIYSEATAKGATFIPIVGAFAGGANVKTKTLLVCLDTNGKVTDYSYSGGSTQSGAGTQSDPENPPVKPVKPPRSQ